MLVAGARLLEADIFFFYSMLPRLYGGGMFGGFIVMDSQQTDKATEQMSGTCGGVFS